MSKQCNNDNNIKNRIINIDNKIRIIIAHGERKDTVRLAHMYTQDNT